MIRTYKNSRAVQASVPSGEVVKKRYADKPAVLTLKMEADFLKQIDDEVLFQSNQRGHIVTRSDVVKDLIREALTLRTKKRGK